MAMTTLATLPPAVNQIFDRLLLMIARPYLIYNKFAVKKALPQNSGRQMVHRRYLRLANATTPVASGDLISEVAAQAIDIVTQIQFYGAFIKYDNQMQLLINDPILNSFTELLGIQMGTTLDALTRDVLAATSNVTNCSNGLNGNFPTELTRADIDIAMVDLDTNDALMITEYIEGTMKFGTQPVRQSYFGFLNSAIITDLQNCDGFISVANYPQRDGLDAEWGSVGNVRWLRSSQGSVNTNVTPNIYNNIIVGREAYACMHLSGRDAAEQDANIAQNGSIIVKPLGSAGALDPANQFGTVSFSVFYAARILNDAFLTNLRSTAA
jgi:N4-gp56 family major capsid protein